MPTTLAPAPPARSATVHIVPGQTLDDLRALPEGTLAQLIDGEIIMSPSPNVLHQYVVTTLTVRLRNFVEEYGLGVVFVAPIDVRLGAQSFQPDVVFVSAERSGILGKQEVEGAPDLVAEVLSPSTGYYDLTKKREAYERAGVREYWIVDPERSVVEVLVLEDGAYALAAKAEREGTVASTLLDGFDVALADLFDALPGA